MAEVRFLLRYTLLDLTQRLINIVQIELFWIKFATNPFQIRIMFFVVGVIYGFEKSIISPYAANVFRRTSPFPFDTHGVLYACLWRQDFFHHNLMLPTIAEIILINELSLLSWRYLVQKMATFVNYWFPIF